MFPKFSAWSRRRFLAASSLALVGTRLLRADPDGAAAPAGPLALDGGEKTVKSRPGPWVRWGQPERERLDEMIGQKSLFYWEGPQTAAMIKRFQQHHPLAHVMTCSSGTAAIHAAVIAAGIGPGDEVITTPISDMGTIIGILYQQGVPVFADLGADTYNLTPASIRRCLTPRTKAIVAVHLRGVPCDLDAIRAIADEHRLILIEDCAQAWGAKYRGRAVGTVGHFGCFSLMNSKLITSGDGGVVGSNDPRFGPLLQRSADKGEDRLDVRAGNSILAPNYRMSEPQAAVAAAQLDRLEGIVEKRSRLGRILTEGISGVPGIAPPRVEAADRASEWFYYFRMQPDRLRCSRDQFVKAVSAEGGGAHSGYIPVPLYGQPVFQRHGFFAGRWPVKELGLTQMDYTQVHCPEAEAILQTGVKLALNESWTEGYVREVAAAIRKVARHYAA